MTSETTTIDEALRVRLVQVTVGLEPRSDGTWRCSVLGEQVALYVGQTGEAVVHRERNDLIGVSHPAGIDARVLVAQAAAILRAFADTGTTLVYGLDGFRHAADVLDAKAQDASAWQTAEPVPQDANGSNGQ